MNKNILTVPIELPTPLDIGYTGDRPIPVVYGAGTVEAVEMDQSGRLWGICSHPLTSGAIKRITVDGKPTNGYRIDTIGVIGRNRGVTVARLAVGAPGSKVECHIGAGKYADDTLREITNAGEIIRDLITMGGIGVDIDDIRPLIASCRTAGIRCTGVIADVRNIKRIIDDIAASTGILWSPQPGHFGVVLPAVGDVDVLLTDREIVTISAVTRLNEVVSTVQYRWKDIEGCSHQIDREICGVGAIRTVDAMWVSDAIVAETCADRIAEQLRRELLQVTVTIPTQQAVPWVGAMVSIQHPLIGAVEGIVVTASKTVSTTKYEVVGRFAV